MNNFYKTCWNLLFLCVLLVTAKHIKAQQTFTHKFTSNGVNRWYGGAKQASSSQPLRLVILFPGTTENLYEMLQRDYNNYLGDNSMVVYPESFNRMAGMNGTDSIDDFQMVQDLIDDVRSKYPIDTNDICIGGFSSGAKFCYELLCDYNRINSTRPYRFRAIAAVSGSIPQEIIDANVCPLIGQVPLIAFHGTADAIASYSGGDMLPSGSLTLHTDTAILKWSKQINLCDIKSSIDTMPDLVLEEFAPSTVLAIKYDCSDAKTHLYKIINGSHSWPDGNAFADYWGANRDINASKLIAEFFENNNRATTEVTDLLNIRVFPNPSSNLISISSVKAIDRIEIYSNNGDKLMDIHSSFNHINISQLPEGIYLLHIHFNEEFRIFKIVRTNAY